MTIKSLLIGSAAAVVAASSAQAADIIVAADPEPVEYVQVCDVFGTGYFYIPGTETCLDFSGYVRAQTTIDDDGDDAEHYAAFRLSISAKSETEYGTLGSEIRFDTGEDLDGVADFADIDRAYITLGGWTVGLAGNPFDFSGAGDAEYFGNGSDAVLLSYDFDLGDTTVTLAAIDDLGTNATPDFVVKAAGDLGDFGYTLAYAYDEFNTVAAGSTSTVKGQLDIGDFDFTAQWTEKGEGGSYGSAYVWALAASYSFAFDAWDVVLGGSYALDKANVSGFDDWGLSLEATYEIVENLDFNALVTHKDGDTYTVSGAETALRLRLTRSF